MDLKETNEPIKKNVIPDSVIIDEIKSPSSSEINTGEIHVHEAGRKYITGIPHSSFPDARTFTMRDGYFVVTVKCKTCSHEWEELTKRVTIGNRSFNVPGSLER